MKKSTHLFRICSNPMHRDFEQVLSIPSSVYRLQLNEEFPLKKAIPLIAYLKELGIESVYCSPIYDAYSSHGYDVTDPNRLNPALGSEKDFEAFCLTLEQHSMGQILDVVPNHMGFKGGKNRWWQDVLENGPYSFYASFFDINWSPEKIELQNKVLLPVLGAPYGEILENQQIRLSFKEGEFWLHYADFPLPVAPHSYANILEQNLSDLKSGLNKDLFNEYEALIEFYRFFPVVTEEREAKKEEGRKRLMELLKTSKPAAKSMQANVKRFNGKKHIAESFDLLDRLLDVQFYRLAYWRVASHEINYRRFFNIHDLVAIRIEQENVLDIHHRWVFNLLETNKVQGLRIDHPDGLFDPVTYFSRLRSRFPVYTFVEKILDKDEKLPESWKVEGTVGYEYLHLLNGLFIRKDQESAFTTFYEETVGCRVAFEEELYRSKKMFTRVHMASEMEALGLKLDRLSEKNRNYRDITRHDLTSGLQELIACFPVYRTYIPPEGKISKRDRDYIQQAIQKAKDISDLDPMVWEFFEKLLLLKLKMQPEEAEGYREFILRFQQLTGPIMAKGLEDTCFYRYNRFISLNEVGGDPTEFGYDVEDFHRFNQEKLEHWPFGLLASSTHDTKRSEDVRMRLNVLSEMPQRWFAEAALWMEINAEFKNQSRPSQNIEYYIYQTLVGVWPSHLPKKDWDPFMERIWEVLLKSLRESRLETSWIHPNPQFEEDVKDFFFSILSFERENLFLDRFFPFQKEIERFGAWNSISATILKIASCGVVDIYEGNETLNLRLVDPDNRRPVDFEMRQKLLKHIKKKEEPFQFAENLNETKLFLHWRGLNFRKENKSLFLEGEYIPLKTKGVRSQHLIAFARRKEDAILIVLVGRFYVSLIPEHWETPTGEFVWGDTEIMLPKEWENREWRDLFTEKKMKGKRVGKKTVLHASEVFHQLPVSYLYG